VHMVLGGGGTSAPSNGLFFHPPQCRVITGVGDPNPTTGKRPPIYLWPPKCTSLWADPRSPVEPGPCQHRANRSALATRRCGTGVGCSPLRCLVDG